MAQKLGFKIPYKMVRELDFTIPLDKYKTLSRTFAPNGLPHPIKKIKKPHFGDDVVAKPGQPVYAIEDGVVYFRDDNPTGYGNYADVDHGKNIDGSRYSSRSAHLDGFNKEITKRPVVNKKYGFKGYEVKKGEIIGYAGTTGGSTGVHLHFEILKDGVRVNPREAIGLVKSRVYSSGISVWQKPIIINNPQEFADLISKSRMEKDDTTIDLEDLLDSSLSPYDWFADEITKLNKQRSKDSNSPSSSTDESALSPNIAIEDLKTAAPDALNYLLDNKPMDDFINQNGAQVDFLDLLSGSKIEDWLSGEVERLQKQAQSNDGSENSLLPEGSDVVVNKLDSALTEETEITNDATKIFIKSFNDDLGKVFDKMFSDENASYAAAQLAMGAKLEDVAKYIVVNTIANSTIDASIKATFLRNEYASGNLNNMSESYDAKMADNAELSSLKTGVSIFITSAILAKDKKLEDIAKDAAIQGFTAYASKVLVDHFARETVTGGVSKNLGHYYAGASAIISGILNGDSFEDIAKQTFIAVSSSVISTAITGFIMSALSIAIPFVGTILGAVIGSYISKWIGDLFGNPPPPPPPLFKIEEKEDGSGKIVYSLHEQYTIILQGTAKDDAVGRDGGEILIGSEGDNGIYGLGGDDILTGENGNDKIFAGSGNDNVIAGQGNDFVAGDEGDDYIEGGEGDDIISAGDGNDRIYGDVKNQEGLESKVIGNDKIDGGAGDDYIEAGAGDDMVYGAKGDDIILGNEGNDNLDGSIGNDNIEGGEGDDVISGGQDDVLTIFQEIFAAKQDLAAMEPEASVQASYDQAVIDLESFAEQNRVIVNNLPAINELLKTIESSEIIGNLNLIKISDGAFNYEFEKNHILNVKQIYEEKKNLIDSLKAKLGEYEKLKTFIADNQLDDISIFKASYDEAVANLNNFASENESIIDSLSQISEVISRVSLELQISAGNFDDKEFIESLRVIKNDNSSALDAAVINDLDLIINSAEINDIYQQKNDLVNSTKQNLDANIEQKLAKYQISGVDKISGGNGADKIFGFSGDDILFGDDGDDIIQGGYGADNIDGGKGNDTIIADEDERDYLEALSSTNMKAAELSSSLVNGNDIINAGDGDDSVSLAVGYDEVDLGAGNDILENQFANALIYAGLGDDQIVASGGHNEVYAQEGNDEITLGIGDDYINGGEGNDNIDAGDGYNIVDGGAGNDLLLAGINNDELNGDDGDDIIQDQGGDNLIDGGAGNDYVVAGDGDDIISTGSGTNDYVFAGAGNDIVFSQAQNATLIGGVGNDLYQINNLTGEVVIEDNGDSSDIDGIEFSYDRLSNLKLKKAGDDLVIEFSDNSARVTVKNNFAAVQNSKIELLKFGEIIINLNSVIFGTAASETINGSLESDTILGDLGMDIIYGREGDDFIDGQEGDDVIYGEEGNDTLKGSQENDIIYGGAGNDRLIGNEGNDILEGGDGNDIFVITKPSDSDTISDFVVGNDKIDLTNYNQFSSLKTLQYFGEAIEQNAADVVIKIDSNTNVNLQNQNIADILQSQNFIFDIKASVKATDNNDILVGTSGNDIIKDGKGSDIMSAGTGNDIFTITKNAGDIDTISDFDVANDKIDLRNIDNYVDILQLDISQKNNDTIIALDDGQKIILENVRSESLLANNFKFAIFDGVPQTQRYSGPIDYNFAEDNIVEQTTAGIAGAGIDATVFEQFIASGIGYNSVNFGNSENIWNEGVSRVLTNNVRYESSGGKNSQQVEKRDTTFSGSSERVYYEYVRSGKSGYFAQRYDQGNDKMYGAMWSETIYADSGNDEVYAGGGDDTVYAGTGNDYVDGQTGNDTLYGESGNDRLLGGDGNDYLDGGADNDYLNGDAGNDSLYGGSGSDKLEDSEGSNLLSGQGGNDQIIAGAGNDTIYGGAGNDHINAGAGDDYIDGDYDIVSYQYQVTVSNGKWSWQETRTGYRENTNYGDDYINAGTGNDVVRDMGGNNLIYLAEGDDRATLGVGNDYVDGGVGNDRIYSGAGNDTIVTGSGNDYAEAGQGNDQIMADLGLNWLHGGAGADNIQGGNDADIIYGGSGEDIINGGAGSDLIVAGTNNDRVNGGSDADDISLGQGNDTAYGDDGDDLIKGEDGNDIIYGGTGKDSISGGNNNDIIYGQDGNDIIAGDDGNDEIYGEEGSDIIDGGNGDDKIYGGNGNNLLRGGFGADIFVFDKNNRFRDVVYGLEAADIIDISSYSQYTSILQIKRDGTNVFNSSVIKFADGNQIAIKGSSISKLNESQFILNSYNSRVQENEVNLNAKTLYSNTNGYLNNDLATSINSSNWFVNNNIQLEGGLSMGVRSFNIAQSGNAWNNTINGNANNEWLLGGGGHDYINGNAGNDVIDGGSGNDVIYGGDGNDIIVGNVGNDLIYGDEGDDSIMGGDGNDVALGGNGNDSIQGGNGNDFITGQNGDDLLYGNDGEDIIEGNDGNDYIESGANNDVVYGDKGNDRIYLASGNDFASGGSGRDYIEGQDGDDIIYGDSGHDKLIGGTGADKIFGGSENDIIFGNDDNDSLFGEDGSDIIYDGGGDDIILGGAGDDIIYAGNGTDIITGDLGRDIFSFEALDSSTALNCDLITDFTRGDDVIDLSNIGISSFAAIDIANDGTDTTISDQNSAFVVKLSGVHVLSADDFIMSA